MKSFADWTTDLAATNQRGMVDELPEGLYYMGKGEYKANCVICGELKEVYCDPKEFDATYFYCGGSPRCCP